MHPNSKNPIREAVCQLHYATMKYFETVPSEEMRLSDLKGFLKTTIPKISINKDIQKILKKEATSIISSAKSVSVKGKFDKSKLMYDLYDGILLTKDIPHDKMYDAIVLQTPSKVAAHIWYPKEDEIFDELEVKLEAENDYDKKCSLLIVKNPIKPTAKTAPAGPPIKIRKAKQPTPAPAAAQDVIGKIRQSGKHDYRLNVNPEKDQIHGVVFEKYANSIRPNDILKIENDSADHHFIVFVVDIKAIPISAVGVTKQFSELSTQVLLRPMLEVAPGYKGKPRPGNIVGYYIKQPTDAELIEALHAPDSGIPLGWVDYNNSDHVFYFPLEPKDSIYQSMMIAGVQNKGKSNFVKLLIMGLSSMEDES